MPDTAIPCVLVDTSGDGRGDVLLVDTTDDGSADTIIRIFAINLPGDTTGASTSSAAAGPVTAAVAAQQPGGALPIAQTAVPIQPGGHAMAMAMPCGDIAYAVQMQSGATPPPNQPGALVPNGAGFSENDEFSLLSGASPMDPAGGPQAGRAVACAQASTARALWRWRCSLGISSPVSEEGGADPIPMRASPKRVGRPRRTRRLFAWCSSPARSGRSSRVHYRGVRTTRCATATFGYRRSSQQPTRSQSRRWRSVRARRISRMSQRRAICGRRRRISASWRASRSTASNGIRSLPHYQGARRMRCATATCAARRIRMSRRHGRAAAMMGQTPRRARCRRAGQRVGHEHYRPRRGGSVVVWQRVCCHADRPRGGSKPDQGVVAATVMPPGGSKGDPPMAQAVRAEEVPDSNAVVAVTVASTSGRSDVRQRAAAILEEEGHAPVRRLTQQIAAQQAAAAAAQGGNASRLLHLSRRPGVPQPCLHDELFWDASSLYGEVLGSIQDAWCCHKEATAAAQAVLPRRRQLFACWAGSSEGEGAVEGSIVENCCISHFRRRSLRSPLSRRPLLSPHLHHITTPHARTHGFSCTAASAARSCSPARCAPTRPRTPPSPPSARGAARAPPPDSYTRAQAKRRASRAAARR